MLFAVWALAPAVKPRQIAASASTRFRVRANLFSCRVVLDFMSLLHYGESAGAESLSGQVRKRAMGKLQGEIELRLQSVPQRRSLKRRSSYWVVDLKSDDVPMRGRCLSPPEERLPSG